MIVKGRQGFVTKSLQTIVHKPKKKKKMPKQLLMKRTPKKVAKKANIRTIRNWRKIQIIDHDSSAQMKTMMMMTMTKKTMMMKRKTKTRASNRLRQTKTKLWSTLKRPIQSEQA
jgi:hypothetical protein